MNLPAISARFVPRATAAQMADADRVASEQLGIPLASLMDNASRQIAGIAALMLEDLADAVVSAVVGSGNNGGDALGALRYLSEGGISIDAYLSGPADRLPPLARAQYDRLAAMGVPLYDAAAQREGFVGHRLKSRSLVIDGLLGYSAKGAPRDMVATLIAAANESGKPILAVDLPSGLDPDRGTAPGAVIRAKATVTLGLPKVGLLHPAAEPYVGELILADIGIPAKAYAGIDAQKLFAHGDVLRIIA